MRYNNLPDSIHFMPYTAGASKKGIHLSHTKKYIYCKTTFTAGEQDFEYVERRVLAKEAAKTIHLLDYGDAIRATNVFESMNSSFLNELDSLNTYFANFDSAFKEAWKLWSVIICTNDKDKQKELMVEFDLIRKNVWEINQSIDRIIQEINKDSKFNTKTKMIGKSKVHSQGINDNKLILLPV